MEKFERGGGMVLEINIFFENHNSVRFWIFFKKTMRLLHKRKK